jgi:hypothetical protein
VVRETMFTLLVKEYGCSLTAVIIYPLANSCKVTL